jgi:titin
LASDTFRARESSLREPIEVTKVTIGKTYVCSVAASNAIGTGESSAPSEAVIVGSPAPPTTVKASSASGSLKVTFKLGADNGSVITGQIATCTSSDGGTTGTGRHSGSTAARLR